MKKELTDRTEQSGERYWQIIEYSVALITQRKKQYTGEEEENE